MSSAMVMVRRFMRLLLLNDLSADFADYADLKLENLNH